MTAEEKQQYQADLLRGLELAEYRMLRDKAMHNETIIQGDDEKGWREVSAREVFVKLYNEPVPTFKTDKQNKQLYTLTRLRIEEQE